MRRVALRLAGNSAVAVAGLFLGVAVVAGERSVPLKNGSGGLTPTMRSAHYDVGSGLCTEGSVQLMSKDELTALKSAWNETATSKGCVEPRKQSTPRRAAYPRDADGKLLAGAAHLLLQVDRDGSVAAIRALCATGKEFSEAAVSTVKSIGFTPRTCGGVPLRTTVLLPFAYDP